jgi:hypothetical protein
MSTVKDYKLELTDYEQVALERRDKKLKFEIAINMLKNNEPVEKVSSYTALTIAEVEELKKNLK